MASLMDPEVIALMRSNTSRAELCLRVVMAETAVYKFKDKCPDCGKPFVFLMRQEKFEPCCAGTSNGVVHLLELVEGEEKR